MLQDKIYTQALCPYDMKLVQYVCTVTPWLTLAFGTLQHGNCLITRQKKNKSLGPGGCSGKGAATTVGWKCILELGPHLWQPPPPPQLHPLSPAFPSPSCSFSKPSWRPSSPGRATHHSFSCPHCPQSSRGLGSSAGVSSSGFSSFFFTSRTFSNRLIRRLPRVVSSSGSSSSPSS